MHTIFTNLSAYYYCCFRFSS